MLSAQHREVVIATLPAIGGAIGEITPIFYRRLFAAHPELERDLFNRGNQANGAQQAALAGAVAMYATAMVDDDATAAALVERVAHKHASLGVAPEQYPIVYEHLFAAIAEVLGAVITPEVAEAWTAVYWAFADELMAREKGLYAEAGTTPATTWRSVVIAERVQQSPRTVAFVLADPSGAPLPHFQAGQYISVGVLLPDGARQIRQYSLSDASDGRWRIGVRRDGSVSSHLHEYAFEGDQLQVSPPFGDIVLDSDPEVPLLLGSAGIGITPVLGMLYRLADEESGRRVVVVHADRTRATHAHRTELTELVQRIPGATLHTWYDQLPDGYPLGAPERRGRVDLSVVEVIPGTHAYLCGPMPFMNAATDQLVAAGLPREDIWFEAFSPSM